MDLPRDEMAFRNRYESLVVSQQLKTVFRPGNRIYPNYRGYKPNEFVTARIIETLGSDLDDVAPVFNEIKVPIQIASIEVHPVDALTEEHFAGSSPDVQSVPELLEHLNMIYNQPLSNFDNEVTRITLNYVKVAVTA